jgi:hypothetical protein
MTPDGLYLGVVLGRAAGEASDIAINITYRLEINFPEGKTIIEGIAPAVERWPAPIKVRAIKDGTAVTVAVVGTQLQLLDRELPDFTPCEQL